MEFQSTLLSNQHQETLQDKLGGDQELKVRKRIFSLDNSEFPGLDDLDENDDSKGSKRKGKHDSGVKFKSNVSTNDSTNQFKTKPILLPQAQANETTAQLQAPTIDKSSQSSPMLQNGKSNQDLSQKSQPNSQKDFGGQYEDLSGEDQQQWDEDQEEYDGSYDQEQDYGEEGEEEVEIEDEMYLPVTKQDDLEYLRYNKVKSKSRSAVLTNEESKEQKERLAKLKAKKELKDQLALERKLSSAYKDVDIKPIQKMSTKSGDRQKDVDENQNYNQLTVLLLGPSQNGKSTICGQILHQMGQVKKIDINKCIELPKLYKKEEFNVCPHQVVNEDISGQWSQYLLDIFQDERQSGSTRELASCSFQDDQNSFTLLDSPGDISKFKEVVEGASLADLAVLVVSAKNCEEESCQIESEFKNQIQDQLMICQGQGLKDVIVLVNKMDHVQWSEDKFTKIKNFLSTQIVNMGFNDANLQFIPTSGSGCQNIKTRVSKSICPWYDGLSLIQALNYHIESNNELQFDESCQDEQTLIQILDKSSDSNDLFIYCKILSGSVKMGSKLNILPHYAPAQVLQLTNCQGKVVSKAFKGQIVTIKLNIGVPDQVQINQYLVDRDTLSLPNISKELKIELNLKNMNQQLLISNGYPCLIHQRSKVFSAVLDRIQIKTDQGKLISPRYLTSHTGPVICTVKLDEPMIFERFDKILLEDINSKGVLGVGQIEKFKPFNLAEISPLFKKRLDANARKKKDEYRNSPLRKKLVSFLAEVGQIQKQNDLSLQDALVELKQKQ